MSSYKKKKEDLLNRLKRIEGQVRGVHRMVEDDKYCADILVQIAAVKGALNKVGKTILEKHAHGCVQNAIATGDGDEKIDELLEILFKFNK
ncbi:metal-sensitive transcriptional regulator [Natroniella sulfidigena]|uniref:metal-sensitive transcriptional regulator n=1 Tax=Natroniella sulfidigena TaxID=723921 RepID=UPI00200A3F2B|nr:metal-sensitive transcriptional regulator [Natroniella sulfidigena]MCK8817207.1 metal-sensitive transcriptional regulator [Natroniella sulfidigena]